MPTTLTQEAVLDRVRELAAAQVAMNPAEVTPDSRLIEDLNYDSLNQVELVMEIEDEFGVTITDESAENVKTVRDAAEVLLSVLAEAGEGH